MFTLSATPVKFIGLLALFTFCVVWELVRTVRARDGVARTSHGLHLAMAVIMLAMVPRSVWQVFKQIVPMPVSIALMVLGVVWFVWRATRAEPGHRLHVVGCALMFTAMTWHLAAMVAHMRVMPGHHDAAMNHDMGGHDAHGNGATGHGPTPMHSAPADHTAMDGGTMNHGAASHDATDFMGHDTMWWFALVGLPLMAWLLAASVMAMRAVVTGKQSRLDAASDFAMNFGMFWMSTGLLVPILPFMKHLAF